MKTSPPTPLLDRIGQPAHLHSLSVAELEHLALEIREEMTDVCAELGGHIGAGLGVVELTIALHYVFNTPSDRIVWDVSHQVYPHKYLTGRRHRFPTLRQLGGLSGFAKRTESEFDPFGAGHASTSIAAALGFAQAAELQGETRRAIAVIGDGGLTGGEALEALYQAGQRNKPLIVVLNDNEMSISPNVGALSAFLSEKLISQTAQRFKREIKTFLGSFQTHGGEMLHWLKRAEDSFKGFFTPGLLFEAMGFDYVGPVDGHNIATLVDLFRKIKDFNGPVLAHVMTTKGKGYEPAEADKATFHGLGPFERMTGSVKKSAGKSWSKAFCEIAMALAEKDPRVVAITAAMPAGTGLVPFQQKYPDRFFDVGIAEQHAVGFAAGMAREGMRPIAAIYSTFLQRALDGVLNDVARPGLPVIFAMDRGGIVGADGETHQGVFDFAYLRQMPNLVVAAPKDYAEMARMFASAMRWRLPTAIRYPRANVSDPDIPPLLDDLEPGHGEILAKGSGVALLAIGSEVQPALAAAQRIRTESRPAVTVANMRFLKPLDTALLQSLVADHTTWIVAEEAASTGGLGTAVAEWLVAQGLNGTVRLHHANVPDEFVKQGPQEHWYHQYGLDVEGLLAAILRAQAA